MVMNPNETILDETIPDNWLLAKAFTEEEKKEFADSWHKFETETYPRLWREAFQMGYDARSNNCVRLCTYPPLDSGHILRVFKSAWFQGWDARDKQITTNEAWKQEGF